MLDQAVPDFSLPGTSNTNFQLSAAQGRVVVIYFYPKDSTPGCTTEAGDFRDLHTEFQAAGADVYGVSRDGMKSHENFKSKLGLPFELLSDGEETLCQLFDVIKMKKMYGKEVRGIERSTFIIDREGVLRREWRGVKVAGHAAAVLEAVKSL